MNRVEMNNEMLEQVNGGSGIFDSGVTAERSRMDFAGLDFAAGEFSLDSRRDLGTSLAASLI